MTSHQTFTIPKKDQEILRPLAEQVRTVADSSEMNEKRELWVRHNRLDSQRPMVLIESWGIGDEFPVAAMQECESDLGRHVEGQLRGALYQSQVVKDDNIVEPYFSVNWKFQFSDYGVITKRHTAEGLDGKGAFNWEPPIKDLDTDFDKLKKRTFSVDREKSLGLHAAIEGAIGDILPLKMRGVPWWTMGLTNPAIQLIGLENLMLFMYDNPEGLHRLMNFMLEDHMALLDWMEREDLLNLNNRNDYVGSGSVGYSNELGCPEPEHVKLSDLWGLSESQETVGVGPEEFEEFVFKYQKPLIERFGLAYYGCCEPVHNRWHVIEKLNNLRKVSISPWCDEAAIAPKMGSDYVYCRKPNPTLISTDAFNEEAIRQDLRHTLNVCRANDCPLEIAMKDVHTVKRQPERLSRWVALAREEIDAVWGVCSP